jgi:hypothetical protein
MMLGLAALAMWWDMAPQMREEFEHWHSHEHFAERLALPGFLRASRWADAGVGEGFFVLYELAAYEALSSPAYLASLNAPTEWSRQLMPHHRHMVRSPCRVLSSRGAAVAGHALTIRLSPASDGSEALRNHLAAQSQQLPTQPGLAGAHLLQTAAPAVAPTTEQRLRGLADRAADWIFLVTGYEAGALQHLAEGPLSGAALRACGADRDITAGLHQLRLTMSAGEAG